MWTNENFQMLPRKQNSYETIDSSLSVFGHFLGAFRVDHCIVNLKFHGSCSVSYWKSSLEEFKLETRKTHYPCTQVNDMILYVGKPKDSIKRLMELMREFGKVVG